jgi:S-adenosyl-L-methionine hydrolase (adenosine-forming)
LSLVTLSTDFGWTDPYVGIMKGVILGINSQARLVDITHALSHHRLLEAAFVLQSAYRYFPAGSIHLVVVDPGVGGERRLIGIQGKDHRWVGPDNGVFTLVLKEAPEATIVHLNNPRFFLPALSQTFHGRDVMAPVAAHLSLGLPLAEMGSPINNPVLLSVPDLHFTEKTLVGQVLWADHFGNLTTNIHQSNISLFSPKGGLKILVGTKTITGIKQNYAQGRPGRLMALFGSSGYLEIACNLGNAAEKLGYALGKVLKVKVICS